MNKHSTASVRAASNIVVPRDIESPHNPRVRRDQSDVEPDCIELFRRAEVGSAFRFVDDPLGEERIAVGYSAFERNSRHPFSDDNMEVQLA